MALSTLAASLRRRVRQGAGEAVLQELYRPIRGGLARSERVLERAAAESGHVIRPMAQHLLRRPGKRIRSALVLYAVRAGRADPGLAEELAAAVEMLHIASLVHDDILDGSTTRRNQPALHAEWGIQRAVLMGDYLFARIFRMLVERFPAAVTSTLLRAAQELCDGEIEETAVVFDRSIAEARYLEIVRKKTAALMAAACEAGAMLAGAPRGAQEGLRRYGEAFGMAFQLIDDALNFSGDEREVGKPVGSDIAEGKFTMPVLYLRRTLKGRERNRFLGLLTPPSLSNGGAREVIALVKAKGAVDQTLERAADFLRQAQRDLAPAAPAAREPLGRLAGYALDRRA